MNKFLKRQFEHDVWATETLLARCRTLTAEQLELTAPGTYGTIRGTLAHIVAADERYLARLIGAWDHEPPREGPETTIDDIAKHLAHVKDAAGRLFGGATLDAERILADTPLRRFVPSAQQIEMATWVPAAQLINHGTDHRTHINTILATHGLDTVDLQIWPYATDLGASRPVKQS